MMPKQFTEFALAAALTLGLSAAAAAQECSMPTVPNVPDGANASEEQMVGAINDVRTFQEEVGAYRECLDAEMSALKAKFAQAEGDKKKALGKEFDALTEKYNKSVAKEKELASTVNAQIGIWKANNE